MKYETLHLLEPQELQVVDSEERAGDGEPADKMEED